MTASPGNLKHLIPGLPEGLLYGGDYNPEQSPESVWEEDIRLMREAGVNLVSLGVFAWAMIEPRPQEYNWAWLDRIIEALWNGGISVCMATATASPPAWLSRRHPESLPVDRDGIRLSTGSRQHYCPNSEAYLQAAAALTRAVAGRYGRHPAVALWHINNEIGCHVTACYCPRCETVFREWLTRRYGTLDALNEAWGTAFWSQRYGSWDEIHPPRRMPYAANPCQELDYRRFMSDSLIAVVDSEITAVRSVIPDARVTTNGVSWNSAVDYRECYRRCDVAALDCYPDPVDPLRAAHDAALCSDIYRSFKQGQPFILMEQVTSQVCWRPVNLIKRPGQMRAWSLMTVGRGADGIMFFQWRASRSGAEKFHGAMVPHRGPESRVFKEVMQLGRELKNLAPSAGGRTPARAALIIGWPNRWALELGSKPLSFDYDSIVRSWHRAAWNLNIAVDIVEPGQPLEGYDLVLAPALYMMTQTEASGLRRYVEQGGTLLLGCFSGIVDEHERIWTGGYPALLSGMLGITAEEWQPVTETTRNRVRFPDGSTAGCDVMCEIVHAHGAEIRAVFDDDFFRNSPALTRNSFGSGRAYYLATQPEQDGLDRIVGELAADLGITPPLACRHPGIRSDLRRTADEEFLFVVNVDNRPHHVDYEGWTGCTDLLANGDTAPPGEELDAFGVRVLIRRIGSAGP